MMTSGLRKLLFAGLLVAAGLLLTFGVVNRRPQPARPGSVFSLQAPPFVNVARAAEASQTTFDLGVYLDQEAGIAAYYKSPDAITLSQAKGACRSVPEIETPDYFICSVPVPSYIEYFDAHVYVHRDGWIMAYYLRPDPTSKIIDLKARTINTTKLKTVVGDIASRVGAPFSDVTYYDFRYPIATNMLLVAEDQENGNNFTIQLPSSFGYLDRGWAMSCDNCVPYDEFKVDGVDKTPENAIDNGYYGTLTVSELLPDITHTVEVAGFYSSAYGVLIITYRVP